MNKTINIIIVSIIIAAWLTQSIKGDTCQCTCCLGNGCTATIQGSFPVNSCFSTNCVDQCRMKYPSCPSTIQSGSSQGFCTSTSALAPSKGYQQQANSVWVIMFFSLFIIVKKYM
ncbi:unnamed protein product [Adineta steineri]|uniref:Uncharacterized protein n=1 Tax=Adineta steineri TaxID=433720 RepID=A0A813WD02_9BILA|nr:unnamed protein product [Adineta steineri]CAF3921799.1 unnamed protein product [Adineta steineri]CAF4173179.1 unnamed protein product [Adineta steineri]